MFLAMLRREEAAFGLGTYGYDIPYPALCKIREIKFMVGYVREFPHSKYSMLETLAGASKDVRSFGISCCDTDLSLLSLLQY
jgi:hypothetical protein